MLKLRRGVQLVSKKYDGGKQPGVAGVGMVIHNGSAHCYTCTGEPTSITMHIGKSGGWKELLVPSPHHCFSECHSMANVFIC